MYIHHMICIYIYIYVIKSSGCGLPPSLTPHGSPPLAGLFCLERWWFLVRIIKIEIFPSRDAGFGVREHNPLVWWLCFLPGFKDYTMPPHPPLWSCGLWSVSCGFLQVYMEVHTGFIVFVGRL